MGLQFTAVYLSRAAPGTTTVSRGHQKLSQSAELWLQLLHRLPSFHLSASLDGAENEFVKVK